MPDDVIPPETKVDTQAVSRAPTERKPFETGAEVSGLIPRTLDDVFRIAGGVISAKMVPSSFEGANEEETKGRLALAIMKGLEIGFGPITALSTICVINNRPALWGDGAVALIQQKRLFVRVEAIYEGVEQRNGPKNSNDPQADYMPKINDFSDDFTAVYRIWRVGISDPFEGRFSVRDAKRAHLWGNTKKQPWIDYPKRMLMNRARAFALRDGFSDALMGIAIAEEAQDIAAPVAKTDTSSLDDGWTPSSPPQLEASKDQPMPLLDAIAGAKTFEELQTIWLNQSGEDATVIAAYEAKREELAPKNLEAAKGAAK